MLCLLFELLNLYFIFYFLMQHTKASYNTIIYSSHFLPELVNDNLWFEYLFSKDFQLGLPGLESVVIFCSDAHLVDN